MQKLVLWLKRLWYRPTVDELRGMTKEQRFEAVRLARSERQLRDMWAVWRAQGWSEGGMLHRAVVERIADDFNVHLSPDEAGVYHSVPAGRGLPPITGHLTFGGK